MTDKELRTFDLSLADARAEVRDGRTLTGYAAVFNQPVQIDSLQGSFMETWAPGSFTKTLRERGDLVQVQLNHGADGGMPLGKPTLLQEDDYGLRFEVPFYESVRNNEILAAVKARALRGVSIQFMPTRIEWNKDRTERTIKEAALYEFGPVTFPAQPAATMEVRCAECERRDSTSEGSRESTSQGSRDSTFDEITRRQQEQELETQDLEARILSIGGRP